MRLYNIAVSSLAIDAPIKWTDNLLSHHRLPGVISVRRGVTRGIPHEALVRLAIVRELHVRLGLGVADAVKLANHLLEAKGAGVHESGQLRVFIDLPALRRALDTRLREALESAPAPRRGRPPRRSRM